MAKTRRPRRSLPRRREGGINPALSVGAGAVGAAVGAGIARRRNASNARKSVGEDVAFRTFGGDTRDAAVRVYKDDYADMPRADADKLNTYKNLGGRAGDQMYDEKKKDWVSANRSNESARKRAAMSKSDLKKYRDKTFSKIGDSYNDRPAADYMRASTKIRTKAGKARATRRGAAVGGVSTAVVTTIVQAVLNELNKK